MKSVHVPQHIVLKLSMDDRDQLLWILGRVYESDFTKKMKKALYKDKDIELEKNEFLPW